MQYVEPFAGSLAMLFYKQPSNAIISDVNAELMNVYACIRENLEELLFEVDAICVDDCKEHYYKVRDNFNHFKEDHVMIDAVQAARFLYLNARCYNGLYRENKDGKFNAPFGASKKDVLDAGNAGHIRRYLLENNIDILTGDYTFAETVANQSAIKKFYFLDPPYVSRNDRGSFRSYSQWNVTLEKLKEFVDRIDGNGDLFLLCNHSTDEVVNAFSEYEMHEHMVPRAVSQNVSGRNPVKEIIVCNYKITTLLSFG